MSWTTTSTACEHAIRILATHTDSADPDGLRRARAHIAACPRCSALLDDTGAADAALAALRREQSTAQHWWRVALAGLSVIQLAIALAWLLGANPLATLSAHVHTAHLTRDGALCLTIASAGLLTAWQQRYASGAFAVSLAACFAHIVAALSDSISHHLQASFEVVHLLPLAITILILVGLRHDRLPRAAHRPGAMRLVRGQGRS